MLAETKEAYILLTNRCSVSYFLRHSANDSLFVVTIEESAGRSVVRKLHIEPSRDGRPVAVVRCGHRHCA